MSVSSTLQNDVDSVYACSILTSSTTSTRSDIPGTGRVIDKYIYEPVGRLIESAVRRTQLSGNAETSEPAPPHRASPHRRPRHRNHPPRTTAREFWFYATNAQTLSVCSLATASSTSTRSDNIGPGRIVDKYMYQVVGKMIERCLGRIALKVGPNANVISQRIRETTPFYVEGFSIEFVGFKFALGSVKMAGCMKLVTYAHSGSIPQQISALQNIIFLAKECATLLPFFESDCVLEAIRSLSAKRIGGSNAVKELEELKFWTEHALDYLESTALSRVLQDARDYIQSRCQETFPAIVDIAFTIRYALYQVVSAFRIFGITTYTFSAARYAKNLFELTSFFGIQILDYLSMFGQHRATVFAELLYDVFTLIVGLRCGMFNRGGSSLDIHARTYPAQAYVDWIFDGMDYEMAFSFDQLKYDFIEAEESQVPVRLRRLKAMFDLACLFHRLDLQSIFPVATEDALLIDWKAEACQAPAETHRWVVDTLWEDCMSRADKFLQIRSLEDFEQFLQNRWSGSGMEHQQFLNSLIVHSRSILDLDESFAIAELFGEAPYAETLSDENPSSEDPSSAESSNPRIETEPLVDAGLGLTSRPQLTPTPRLRRAGRSSLFRSKLRGHFNK